MYIVTFMDGTTFQGGDPLNSRWNEMPNLPIKSIEYHFNPFLKYLLTDFDSYNHMVEHIRGVNQPLDIISRVIIMGRVKNRVYQVMMEKDGNIYQMVVPYGEEYSPQTARLNGRFNGWINAKPLSGWREGAPVEDGVTPHLQKIDHRIKTRLDKEDSTL